MRLQVEELGRRWVVPALVLGPGIIIALGAIPLALVVDFRWVIAFIGCAILASTDPVVLRDVVRDSRIPRSVRQILKLEAGMNDLVVLPVVLILVAVAQEELAGVGEWTRFLGELLLLGPLIGFAIGGAGAYAMARVDGRMGIGTEYQALYGVGLVLAAYSAAASLGGDGFLAAFFAGLAVVVLNQTLCDCFLEYGEVTAEMAMLLAFVLFGAVLASVLDEVQWGPALALAALVVFVIRALVLNLVLLPATLSWEARVFVAWFGPRGLNSLLLALLVVHAALPEATELLATVGVVVIASVVLHGASAPFLSAWYGARGARDAERGAREHGRRAVPARRGDASDPDRSAGRAAGGARGADRARRAIAVELRARPCPHPGRRARAARRGARLGGRAPDRAAGGRVLHLSERGDERPCGATAPGAGDSGSGARGRLRRLARALRRRADGGPGGGRALASPRS